MITINNYNLESSLSQDTINELHKIADRHNINYNIILKLYIQGLMKGFSSKTSIIGIRLALGLNNDKEEYFSADDIAEITGMSKEEAEQEMIKTGKALKISFLE